MNSTPLREFHLRYGAKMVDFAGWEMPMTYAIPAADGGMWGGIMEEHRQVRTSGGFFDVSHMGRVRISGRHARKFLERTCTRRIGDMQQGQCRYSLVCNERGGVHDDVIVYRMDDDDFTVVVNASNREKMLAHFERVRSGAHPASPGELVVKIDDQTTRTGMVALQGPRIMELVSKVSSEVPTLKRYRFAVKNLLVMKLVVSRTGYTGEDGVEVILPSMAVDMAMKLLLKDIHMEQATAAVRPAGLGARDTLRMEAAMPLYGHELGEEICALACGVDFAISLDKDKGDHGERFVGQDALQAIRDQGGPARRLMGIVFDGKRTARQGMEVRGSSGGVIGMISSACLSPTLSYPIAMAFLDGASCEVGSRVTVDTGRAVLEGKVAPMPFYKAAK